MRRLGSVRLIVAAGATVALGAFASPLASGSLAPLITHAPRLASEGPALTAGTAATWSSSNWSGYAETGTFTAVSGSWTVPSVTAGAAGSSRGGRFGFGGGATSAWYSAAWLGIDGYNNSNLIQTGTEQDFYDGSAHYSAWWEILPAAETVISEPVSPGDVMTATIAKTSSQVSGGGGGGLFGRGHQTTTEYEWTITIADRTHPWTFTTTQPYNGPGSSAEWIVEAPEVGSQIASLADYSFPMPAAAAGDFNSAEVASTLGGPLTGAGLSYSADAGVMVQNNAQVSTPGPQDSAGTAYNALYGASAPAQPTS